MSTETPITDFHEKSPFQHATGVPPSLYMSVESSIVRKLEIKLAQQAQALAGAEKALRAAKKAGIFSKPAYDLVVEALAGIERGKGAQ